MKSICIIILCLLPAFGFSQAELETRSLVDNKVELLVPKAFKQMAPEMLNLKYANRRNQPNHVLTDEDGVVNIVLVYLEQKIKETDLGSFKDFQVATIKEKVPDVKWMGDGVKTVNGKKVGYCKFISKAIDQNIYNYMAFAAVEGRLLLITFNCTEKLLPDWEDAAEKIMTSLKTK